MAISYSYGIIPYIWEGDEVLFLVIQEKGGKNWSFPKGHLEKGETAAECRLRELLEETGLTPKRVLEHEPLSQKYNFYSRREQRRIYRDVRFVIGEIEVGDKDTVVLQEDEVAAYKWLSRDDIIYDQDLHEKLRENADQAWRIINQYPS